MGRQADAKRRRNDVGFELDFLAGQIVGKIGSGCDFA